LRQSPADRAGAADRRRRRVYFAYETWAGFAEAKIYRRARLSNADFDAPLAGIARPGTHPKEIAEKELPENILT
jgi:hypothetical protein